MSAVRSCRECKGDIVERLVAGHLEWRHLVEPKRWHRPEPGRATSRPAAPDRVPGTGPVERGLEQRTSASPGVLAKETPE